MFYGDLYDNIERLIKITQAQAIFLNEDYTPFSIARDKHIKEICNKLKIDFHSSEDLMLQNIKTVLPDKGIFFKVFTPYCNAAFQNKVREVDTYEVTNFVNEDFDLSSHSSLLKKNSLKELLEHLEIIYNNGVEVNGGRNEALKIVENLTPFKDYKNLRMFPKIPSTRLSAYLKFGCISVREFYFALKNLFGPSHELIRQLQWRDYFMKVPYFWPYVIGGSFKKECDNIQWQAEDIHIEAWKQGKTGFPIVDASMRCLNTTGYMHNKLRTVVCSFLVKDILADWRIGEKYFANQLVDYDISLNNGGWQWTASVGTDSQSEPRVYNPVMQSEKLDPDCEFIIKWIPELKDVKLPHIHNWEKYHHMYKDVVEYPVPIFSHHIQKEKALKMFADCIHVNSIEKFTRYDTNEFSSYTNSNYNNFNNKGSYTGKNDIYYHSKENTEEKNKLTESGRSNDNYKKNYNKPKNSNEVNFMNMIHGGNNSANNLTSGPKKNYKGK
jgi:deoxyribodipyrimidine photo-lyase